MPHHQQIEEVPGKQLWIETWSWSGTMYDWVTFGFTYTSLGGEVNIWKERPSERKETPTWQRVICAFFPFNLFCLIIGAIVKARTRKKLWDVNEEVVIKIRNTYFDRAGLEVEQKDTYCNMTNSCELKESAVGFGYVKNPQLGANLTPIVAVKTEAAIIIRGQQFNHETWAGPVAP